MFLVLFFLVSCNDEVPESKTGIISVLAIDNDPEETPVPDVEITITPGNFVKNTDINGVCFFELESGEYFLDTEVCCAGAPQWHPYQERISVIENDTVEVVLPFCLSCE